MQVHTWGELWGLCPAGSPGSPEDMRVFSEPQGSHPYRKREGCEGDMGSSVMVSPPKGAGFYDQPKRKSLSQALSW